MNPSDVPYDPVSGRPRIPAWTRWTAWTVFWLLVTAFLTMWFGHRSGNYGFSLLFVALLMPVALGTTWLIGEVLVPRFLLAGRFFLFGLYTIYAIIGAVYLEFVVMMTAFILLVGYDASALDPATLDAVSLIVGLFVVVFLFLSIRLVERWHALRSAHERMARLRAEAELRLREVELDTLRGQIHPHVLFNSLNNLYALTLDRSDAAPETVLRLADLLEYMLYRGREETVPVSEEIDILRTYASLERLRFDRPVDVDVRAEGSEPEPRIPPLLLLPLLENAFKHGVRPEGGADRIAVRVEWDADRVRCRIANPLPAADPVRTGPGGIGLENVRRRLELLYPGRHAIDITREAGEFVVSIDMPSVP